MSAKIVVTGSGILSSLGNSARQVFQKLCTDRPIPLSLNEIEGDLRDQYKGFPLGAFSPKPYLGDRNYRPLDRVGRFSVTAAHLALEDAGWEERHLPYRDRGLVLGTYYCGLETIMAFDRSTLKGPKYAKPMDFANTVINAAAGQTALWHRLEGVNSTIASGMPSGLQAIGQAHDVLRLGRASGILAGGAEALCFESLFGFHKTGVLAQSGERSGVTSVPFHQDRHGFSLGEGAAFLALESLASASSRNAEPLAEVKAYATGFDPSSGADEEGAVATLARTMVTALGRAGLKANQVDGVSASANGSCLWDGLEAKALERVFGDDGPPVTAVKAAMGEGLGASGAFQALLAVRSICENRLPPIWGLDRPDPALPSLNWCVQQRDLNVDHVLVHSVGNDGGCCAMVLGPSPSRG